MPIPTKEKFVIGRKWNNPQIYAFVTDEKIEMHIDLKDFIHALAQEIGSSIFLTKKSFETKLTEAALKVTEEIKKASVEVT